MLTKHSVQFNEQYAIVSMVAMLSPVVVALGFMLSAAAITAMELRFFCCCRHCCGLCCCLHCVVVVLCRDGVDALAVVVVLVESCLCCCTMISAVRVARF